MSIDIPVLDGEEWWASESIDDADSLIRRMLELVNSCIELKIMVGDAKLLHAELSLHNRKHNIELDINKWLAFCIGLRQTEISEVAFKVENNLSSFASKHLDKRE